MNFLDLLSGDKSVRLDWKVESVFYTGLQDRLNSLSESGWNVFKIDKIDVGSGTEQTVSVHYVIVANKHKINEEEERNEDY